MAQAHHQDPEKVAGKHQPTRARPSCACPHSAPVRQAAITQLRGCFPWWRHGPRTLKPLPPGAEQQRPQQEAALPQKALLKKDGGAGGRTALVVQQMAVCLSMQGTWVQSLVQEDSHASGELSPRATTTQASILQGPQPQLLSLHAATAEARSPRACTPQQEKPPQDKLGYHKEE